MTATLTTARRTEQRLGLLSLLHAVFSGSAIGAWAARRDTRRAVRAAEAAVVTKTYRHWRGYGGGMRVRTGPESIATGYRTRTHSTKSTR